MRRWLPKTPESIQVDRYESIHDGRWARDTFCTRGNRPDGPTYGLPSRSPVAPPRSHRTNQRSHGSRCRPEGQSLVPAPANLARRSTPRQPGSSQPLRTRPHDAPRRDGVCRATLRRDQPTPQRDRDSSWIQDLSWQRQLGYRLDALFIVISQRQVCKAPHNFGN